MNRAAAYGLIGILVLFQCWWGLAPALTRVDTDFPNYYVASRLVLEGRDLSRIYDDAWFQGEIAARGIQQQGRFAPFPPATAFVMMPLAFLSPAGALRAWTVLNVALAAVVVVLLARVAGRDFRWSALLLLGTGIGLANNFRFGQFYLVITAALLLGLLLYLRGRTVAAGIVWGLAASIKYLPGVLLVYFLLRREWKPAFAGLAAVAAVHAMSGLLLGFGVEHAYVADVLGGHLTGAMPDPSSPVYQSWPSLFRRLSGGAALPGAYAAVVAAACGLFAAVYAATRRIASPEKARIALVILCTMAVLPASATYHFIILAVPVALLLGTLPSGFWARAVIVCYAAIGFIPYSFFGRLVGVAAPLAYPRLWLTAGLYVLAAAGVWDAARRETETETVRVEAVS